METFRRVSGRSRRTWYTKMVFILLSCISTIPDSPTGRQARRHCPVLDIVSNKDKMREQDQRTNSAIAHLTIQRALNLIQVKDLSQAEEHLQRLRPFDNESSLMEQAVDFRKRTVLGRIMRYQGRFSESYNHLRLAHDMIEEPRGLHFDEDRRDLACEFADTLRELGNLELASSSAWKSPQPRRQSFRGRPTPRFGCFSCSSNLFRRCASLCDPRCRHCTQGCSFLCPAFARLISRSAHFCRTTSSEWFTHANIFSY
ncbi:hypothetical protein F5883DRAFT_22735 [Diaporthe sp. PMI_573]|nr:hypothetical protein F5883DRAFT_22735 [Diaporthaceae sp. PMI_573]